MVFSGLDLCCSEADMFENMIATSLYRFTVSLNDWGWPEVKPFYVMTYDKKN